MQTILIQFTVQKVCFAQNKVVQAGNFNTVLDRHGHTLKVQLKFFFFFFFMELRTECTSIAVILNSCPPQKMLLKKNCGGKTRTIKIRVSLFLFNFVSHI